jgi:hypothetical protein
MFKNVFATAGFGILIALGVAFVCALLITPILGAGLCIILAHERLYRFGWTGTEQVIPIALKGVGHTILSLHVMNML